MAVWLPCLRTHNKRKRQKTAFIELVHDRFSCWEENLEALAQSPDVSLTDVTVLDQRKEKTNKDVPK